MKTHFYFVFFALFLNCSSRGDQSTSKPDMFYENRCIAKGGIGIVSEDIYIVLDSSANELIVSGEKWHGEDRATPEPVFIVSGKIYNPKAGQFYALQKSILISFEKERVYFFNFKSATGGYYNR